MNGSTPVVIAEAIEAFVSATIWAVVVLAL